MAVHKLTWHPIRCTGHGLCAEIFPQRVELDDWGYPVISLDPIPPEMLQWAARAVAACPERALRLIPADPGRQGAAVLVVNHGAAPDAAPGVGHSAERPPVEPDSDLDR